MFAAKTYANLTLHFVSANSNKELVFRLKGTIAIKMSILFHPTQMITVNLLVFVLSQHDKLSFLLGNKVKRIFFISYTVKLVLTVHSKGRLKWGFKTDYRLMQVKRIAGCSNGSILQYFRPSLSYQL